MGWRTRFVALSLFLGLPMASPCTIAQQLDAAPVLTPSRVSLQFDRPGLIVPRFTLVIAEDGNGTYEAEQVLQPQGARDVSTASSQHIERKLNVTPATTAKIFVLARSLDRFHAECASRAKNIANTGTKTFRFEGPEGDGSCVFNFSENKNVVALTDVYQGIASTLDMGRKLDFDHRFDRLGLDADMAALTEDVAQGRSLELGTIARTLHSLAIDPDVLERVRLRANALLERFPAAN
jgi:hypothetical protein